MDFADGWYCNERGCCNRTIFCDGDAKGCFEEGFNFGLNVLGDLENKPRRKVEACVRANYFELDVRFGSNNVILKSSI